MPSDRRHRLGPLLHDDSTCWIPACLLHDGSTTACLLHDGSTCWIILVLCCMMIPHVGCIRQAVHTLGAFGESEWRSSDRCVGPFAARRSNKGPFAARKSPVRRERAINGFHHTHCGYVGSAGFVGFVESSTGCSWTLWGRQWLLRVPIERLGCVCRLCVCSLVLACVACVH